MIFSFLQKHLQDIKQGIFHYGVCTFFLVLIDEGIEDQRLFEIISQDRDESSIFTDTEGPPMFLPNSFTHQIK